MQLLTALCWVFLVTVDPTKVDPKVIAWLEEEECLTLPGTSLLQIFENSITSPPRELGKSGTPGGNSGGLASSSETPVLVESSQEPMAAVAMASMLPPLAEQLLSAPDTTKESLAGALLQSQRDQFEEKMRSLRMLSQLQTKSADLQEQVEELRRELKEKDDASQPIQTLAGSRAEDDNSSSVAQTAGAATPAVKQQLGGALTAAQWPKASAAKARVASWGQSALAMVSSSSSSVLGMAERAQRASSMPLTALMCVASVLLSAILGIIAGVIGSLLGWFSQEPEDGEPRKTPRWLVNYVFLTLIPCVFLLSSLVWVQDFDNSYLQNYSYLALVNVLMLLQCMLAAGPIADGLVDACLRLPKVIVNAFTSLNEDLGDKLSDLLVDILGETPLDKVVDAVIKILTSVVSPALTKCAEILDVRNFLPPAFFDVSMLIPFLGVGLFVLFVQVWAILANVVLLKIGIATISVACLMWVLLIAALTSNKIVQGFVYTLQGILNYSFRTIMVTLIPTEALDPALAWLGPAVPSATDLKMKIVELLELKLNLEDPSEEDNAFEQFGDVFEDAGCCRKDAGCC
mmetsp:Transcript_6645/g.11853  ORF Transcript_6645/g.11853 Transcript_6645/m.11853 type:complete len:574 (+) Transcript_6645:125-1846(+)